MRFRAPLDLATVKGFMPGIEGEALFASAMDAPPGPMLEIGSYCGKSAVYLGVAAQQRGELLFTIDHHRGSVELQPGWAHHDPETWDMRAGAIDTLPFLRDTLRRAGLESCVIPVVGPSAAIAGVWATPLAFVFIDGGHGMEPALADYRGWSQHVMPGGFLAIHDVFPDPKDGGRPPFEIFCMALQSGHFAEAGSEGSLRVLRRL